MPIDISLVSSNVVITEVSGHKKGWKPMSASYEFDANSNLLLTINGQTRSIPLADLTVSGVAPANVNAAIAALAAVFLNAGGAATTTFTALTGTAWDGTNKYKTLTGNTALTLSVGSNISGILHVYQDATGSRTLSINGVSFTINTAANSVTGIGYYVTNGVINFTTDLNIVQYTPDVTAPTMSSASAVNSSTVQTVMSESVSGTVAGWSMKQNGVVIYPVSVSGTTTRSLIFSETLLNTDTFLISYDSILGDTLDAAGNELNSFTDVAVTNNILVSILAAAPWKQYNEADSGVTQSGGLVSVVADQIIAGGNTTYDLVQATGANQPAFVASALNGHPGINIDTSKSLVQRAALSDAPRPLVRAALVVFTAINTGGTYNYVGYFSGGSSRCDFGLDNTGKPFMYSGTLLVGTTALVINTPYWIWCEYEAGGTGKMYINNTLVASGSTGAHTTYNGGGIGDAADGAKAYVMLNGYIDSLPNSTVRTNVYNAVKAKYGF